MLILPLDEQHAIIYTNTETYFYSRPLESLYVHVPGEYPTMKLLDKKYKLPKFDNIIETAQREKISYNPKIFEIGVIQYSNPMPPGIFLGDFDNNHVNIGVLEFPLEHRVCDKYADVIKIPFGTVSVHMEPGNNSFFVSIASSGGQPESLYSTLLFLFSDKSVFEDVINLILRTLERSNPIAYNKELDSAYREMIMKKFEQLRPKFTPIKYEPIYYNNNQFFVENPHANVELDPTRTTMLKTILKII